MGQHFVKVKDVQSLKELLNRSQEKLVVIFKHSRTCPISAAAYAEMTRFDGEVALVEVQSAREVSREIEEKTGVAHESPQVLILRDGKAIWNASHWRVKAAAVEEAVRNSN